MDWVAACGQSAALFIRITTVHASRAASGGWIYVRVFSAPVAGPPVTPCGTDAADDVVFSEEEEIIEAAQADAADMFPDDFWTTSEVHCGSVVFPTDVSFVECCPGQPYEPRPCWFPKGDQARP